MRKIGLSILGLYFTLLSAQAQQSNNTRPAHLQPAPILSEKQKDSTYKARRLKIEEINFVTGYYWQDGNNSAVTGGIGTEQLTDISNNLDLKLSKLDKNSNKHTFNFELGIDAYTSASNANIDPNPAHTVTVTSTSTTTTSASHGGGGTSTQTRTTSYVTSAASISETRIYPSINYNFNNQKKRFNLGFGLYVSKEYDYRSFGLGMNFSKTSKDKSREFSARIQAYFDKWDVILPVELRPSGYGSGSEHDSAPIDHKPRNTYNSSFSLSQMINQRLQIAFLTDFAYQEGLLATRFHRVYFTDGSAKVENLPSNRFKIPLGFRASYFLGDRTIIRAFYRYYWDTWQMRAHTMQLEIPYKITPFFSVSPFYRYHTQTAIAYFKPYQESDLSTQYYTSDYDLANLQTNFLGMNLRYTSAKGVLGIKYFNTIELRYGHYTRNTGLWSQIVTLALKFK